MQLLQSIGVNSTLWIQLCCFVISYLALSQLIFKPYLKMYNERQKRTVGSEEFAERLIQETQDLHAQYETKARQANQEFKTIYDQTKTAALREHDKVMSAARQAAQQRLEESREKIEQEMTTAKTDLKKQIPDIALAMASKVMGKDLSL